MDIHKEIEEKKAQLNIERNKLDYFYNVRLKEDDIFQIRRYEELYVDTLNETLKQIKQIRELYFLLRE